MTRRHVLLALAVIVALAVPMVGTLAIGAWGRAQNVMAIRAGCRRQTLRNVAFVNVTRASAVANHLVATDRTQSARTRRARATESAAQQAAVLVLDRQTDAAYWSWLASPIDKHAVRYGLAGHKPFMCNAAYPITGLIP